MHFYFYILIIHKSHYNLKLLFLKDNEDIYFLWKHSHFRKTCPDQRIMVVPTDVIGAKIS